jgi:Gpi18-like mannosyltransferase
MMKKDIIKIVIISIGIKIFYFIFALILQKTNFIDLSLTLNFDSFTSIFNKNDTGWYEGIANVAYPIIHDIEELKGNVNGSFQQSEWAFFPAFPILLRVLMKYTGSTFNTLGFWVTFILSTLSYLLFYNYALSYFKDKKLAYFGTVLFIVSPFHYFFSVIYTESLFFVLIMLSIICVLKNKFIYLPFLLCLLTLTRPNGIVVSFCIYIFFVEEYLRNNSKTFFQNVFTVDFILKSFIFLFAPLSLALYCMYQYKLTGYYFAFSIAQEGWEKKDMFPLLALFRKGDFVNQFNSIYTCAVMLFTILNFKKIRCSYHLLIWTTILLPLSKGSVGSMNRYICILFPLFIITINYVKKYKWKSAFIALLYVCQLANFYLWLIRDRFSY